MSNTITYEQPLNERIRVFLRLDFLFQQIGYTMHGDSAWDNRASTSTLIKILDVLGRGRGDIKTEIIKELEKQTASLTRLQPAQNVDHTLLNTILENLNGCTKHLSAIKGRIGNELYNNELLKAIIQRSSIPGGTCNFNLPAYHYWLQLPAATRAHQFAQWMETLDAVRLSVSLLLELLRESAQPQIEIAPGGKFQKDLDTKIDHQLVQVTVPKQAPYFAEISGNKHRFSVRFMETNIAERPRQTAQDVEFHLTCCAL